MFQRVLPTPASRRPRALLAVMMATTLALTAPIAAAHAAAQDGTGGPAPLRETGCVLVPASDIAALRTPATPEPSAAPPTAQATPAPSPAASPVASPMASPVASPVAPDASPVAEQAADLEDESGADQASPTVEPAGMASATPEAAAGAAGIDTELLTENLVAASTSLASCLTERDFAQVVTHTSSVFRGQLVANGRPLPADVYVGLAETFPSIDYRILEVVNPELIDDTTATADVVWQVANQVRVDTWTFTLSRVQGLDVWIVERADPSTTTPSIEASPIRIEMASNGYTMFPTEVASDSVVFEATNVDPVDHELLVLRLDAGVGTDTLLTSPGPQLPAGVTLIGQATIVAGGEGRLLLTGLEPGVYTIVCLLPDANGLPHLASGMETSFTVTAP